MAHPSASALSNLVDRKNDDGESLGIQSLSVGNGEDEENETLTNSGENVCNASDEDFKQTMSKTFGSKTQSSENSPAVEEFEEGDEEDNVEVVVAVATTEAQDNSTKKGKHSGEGKNYGDQHQADQQAKQGSGDGKNTMDVDTATQEEEATEKKQETMLR